MKDPLLVLTVRTSPFRLAELMLLGLNADAVRSMSLVGVVLLSPTVMPAMVASKELRLATVVPLNASVPAPPRNVTLSVVSAPLSTRRVPGLTLSISSPVTLAGMALVICRLPPLATRVSPAVNGMLSVPKPVIVVFAATMPVPVIVPPARVTPFASVSCVVPAPSSFRVLAPIASALVRVSAPLVLTSSVPVEPENVAEVAALAASSSRLSVRPLPIVSASVPLLVMPLAISSVPPVAENRSAPLADTAADSLPAPEIVLAFNVIGEASVRVAPESIFRVLPPLTVCAALIVAFCAISSVLLLVSTVTGLIVTPLWSIFKIEFAKFAIASVWLAVTLPVTSSVAPEAVIVLVPVVKLIARVPEPVTLVLDDSNPVPLTVPPVNVMPFASVSCVVPAPSSLIVLAPTTSWLVKVRVPAVLSSKVPVDPWKVIAPPVLAASSFSLSVAPLPMFVVPVPV